MIRTLLGGFVAVAVVVAAPALAQDTTKAEAKAGLLWLAGNSDSTSLSAGLKITHDAVWQRYSLTAAYAFARSRVYSAPAAPTVIDNLDQLRSANLLSARLWNVTPRFDQWLVHRDAPGDTSVYVLANIASDYAAGKKLYGGAQVGVSTLIFKTGGHSLIGELGYDFTYLQPNDPTPGVTAAGYSIHSIRAALAYVWDLSKATKLTAGAEYLVNVNQESGAPDPVNIDFVSAFQDHRVNAVVGLTTQIYGRLSLNVSWTGRYDAKPNLVTLPANVTSANPPGIFLRTFDSITQVQFVYTLG